MSNFTSSPLFVVGMLARNPIFAMADLATVRSRRRYQHAVAFLGTSHPGAALVVALSIARDRGYRSVEFPLVGAGTGGFPPARVIEIMQDEVRQIDFEGEIRFVKFREPD